MKVLKKLLLMLILSIVGGFIYLTIMLMLRFEVTPVTIGQAIGTSIAIFVTLSINEVAEKIGK